MKPRKGIALLLTAAFISMSGALLQPDSAYAKAITSTKEAEQKALQKVEGATVIESEYDKDDGVYVYDIELFKDSKKYDLTYRASDGKLISYSWEKTDVSAQSNKKKLSESKIRSKAQKKVTNATITSCVQKRDDGIDIYKVKLTSDAKKDRKKYTLEYHARTGALIEYKWELTSDSPDSADDYISKEKAEKIALTEVPGATVVKSKLDTDDGVTIWDVELVKGRYEYEFEIDAKTGRILDYDVDD